jgi:hypothetical protein
MLQLGRRLTIDGNDPVAGEQAASLGRWARVGADDLR